MMDGKLFFTDLNEVLRNDLVYMIIVVVLHYTTERVNEPCFPSVYKIVYNFDILQNNLI